MEKEEVIKIAEALGFTLQSDNYNNYGEWMTFVLVDSKLHEDGFEWMWQKRKSLEENLVDAGIILFRAGQKIVRLRFAETVDL